MLFYYDGLIFPKVYCIHNIKIISFKDINKKQSQFKPLFTAILTSNNSLIWQIWYKKIHE